MPLKKTILAAAAVILLLLIPLAVLWLFPEPAPTVPESTDPPDVQVLFDHNHTEHVEQIRFVYEKRDAISVSRTDNGWQITGRPGLPVSDGVMTPLLTLYEQVLALRRITESCTDPAEYGLDQPSLTVTLTVHGKEKTYLFGDRNDYYEGYYCAVKGSSAVYLLDYAYLTAFDLTAEELLQAQQLPVLTAISSIRWTAADGSLIEDTESLRSALSTLAIDRMVDFGSEQYEVYGLNNAAVGELTLSDGKALTLRLSVGETDELIYLTVDDCEIIYLVTCKDMPTLLSYIQNQSKNG